MLDPVKVQRFWEGRAAVEGQVAFESIGNLEQNAGNLQRKIDDETKKVFDWMPKIDGLDVLDLGAGVGQWTFRFAERGAASVVAVEYAEGMARIGKTEAARRGFDNVAFVVSPVEDYAASERFDFIFISGLFVYLNDDQANKLMRRLPQMLRPGGGLLLRDGTGVEKRHEIDDRYSSHLQDRYSATYRTRQQYVDTFAQHGLACMRDEDMFDEGHPLNKYVETRLRLYRFAMSN